jgi:hypothetical protein
VAVPLAVDVALKEPQAPVVPQVTDQVTPAFLVSLVTTAVRLLVVPVVRDVGGAGLKATEIAGAEMVICAEAAVPEEGVAVMVTVVGAAGAV